MYSYFTVAQACEAAAATNGTKTVNDSGEAKPDPPEVCNAEAAPDTSCKTSVILEYVGPAQTATPQTVDSAETEAATPAPETTTIPVSTTKRVRIPPGGYASKLW